MSESKRENGITLITLVVTIVILLILSGVSVGIIIQNNSIIQNAENAKQKIEIGNEREILEHAIIQTLIKGKNGDITIKDIKNILENNINDGEVEIFDSEDTIVIRFVESNRCYEIDKNGNLTSKEVIKDNYPGDITKGKTLDGKTEETAYQINCIEDLVEFSIMNNGGNKELEIAQLCFTNEYIVLMRDLDFESIFSYGDYSTMKYGDLNQDGITENIKTELTKTEEGCIGFTPIGTAGGFQGIFNGNNHKIENIYQNAKDEKDTALFRLATNEIKNLTLTGNIINSNWSAAGICASGKVTISNCKSYANVTGYNMVGGISAWPYGDIYDCENYGDIIFSGKSYQYGGAGGIAGYASNIKIENCINEGKIIGDGTNRYTGSSVRGGIIGCCENLEINNCTNSAKAAGGIIGWTRGGDNYLTNCKNLGECENGLISWFAGANYNKTLNLSIQNSYNLGNVTNAGIIGEQGAVCKKITLNIENCYNAGQCQKAIIGLITKDTTRTETITNVTNVYSETNIATSIGAITDGVTECIIKDNEAFIELLNSNIGENQEWKEWKNGKNGYPTFE